MEALISPLEAPFWKSYFRHAQTCPRSIYLTCSKLCARGSSDAASPLSSLQQLVGLFGVLLAPGEIHVITTQTTEKRLAWELFSGKYKQTQHKSEKVKNLKYSKTELPWFSCLLQHLARKRGRLILQRPRAHTCAFSLFYEQLIGDNVTFVCRLMRVPFCHLVIYRNVTFSKNLQNFNFQTQHLGIDYLDRNCGEKLRELSDIF